MGNNIFEKIKKVNEHKQDFWSARDIMSPLGYLRWENFEVAILRAKVSCKNSGQKIDDHFRDTTKMITIATNTPKETFGNFQDYGYAGLYGGLRQKDIHIKKQLQKGEAILDYMGSEEMAANLFRATQAEAKLKRENIFGQDPANFAHYDVGKKVRQTIKELGGTMPEKLPTPENIKISKKRINQANKKISLPVK